MRINLLIVLFFGSGWLRAQEPNSLLAQKAEEYYINIPAKPDSLGFLSADYIKKKLTGSAVFVDLLESEVNDERVLFATIIRKSGQPEVIEIPLPRDGDTRFSGVPKQEAAASRGGKVKNQAISDISYCSQYKNFWAYLEPALAGAGTIYYSTSRLLNQANIRFFKDEDGAYLFENYRMVRLHSGASFLGDRHRLLMPSKMDLLLVGNLRYDCNDAVKPGPSVAYSDNWAYLPGTRAELEDIQATMKGNHYIVKLDSCRGGEARFMKTLNSARFDIVHIATHGFYYTAADATAGITDDSYSLERTGIVLSGGNSKKASVEAFNEEGLLTAIELQTLDLSRIRFMVLSTCHSGQGDNSENTATLGLTLSLQRQGVNAMLVSNRAVPDRETSLFMKTFYRILSGDPDVDSCYHKTIRELHEQYPAGDWSFFDLIH